MIKNTLLFSFLVSILSLLIVFIAPVEIAVRETGKINSPYQGEIDRLLEKGNTSITLSESTYLDGLVEQHNQWHKEYRKDYIKNSSADATEAWKKKSNYSAN